MSVTDLALLVLVAAIVGYVVSLLLGSVAGLLAFAAIVLLIVAQHGPP